VSTFSVLLFGQRVPVHLQPRRKTPHDVLHDRFGRHVYGNLRVQPQFRDDVAEYPDLVAALAYLKRILIVTLLWRNRQLRDKLR
jgi:hypothetical protein